MTPLTEKYRPTTLDQVIGNPKAVAVARHAIERGMGGRAVWIAGPSGTGKTTIARIMAESIADQFYVQEYVGRKITPRVLDDMDCTQRLYSLGKGGRAFIINEAHGLSAPVIEQLLNMLDSGAIPKHVCWLFTTTIEGQTKLFDDSIDASPLLARCGKIKLTNQGLAQLFAARAREIAQAENLNGQPESTYVRLVQRCKNNMREVLQSIDDREMIQ